MERNISLIIAITRTYCARGELNIKPLDEWIKDWKLEIKQNTKMCPIPNVNAGFLLFHGCRENIEEKNLMQDLVTSAIKDWQLQKTSHPRKISNVYVFAHIHGKDDNITHWNGFAKDVARRLGADEDHSFAKPYRSTGKGTVWNLANEIKNEAKIAEDIRSAVAHEVQTLTNNPQLWLNRLQLIKELLLRIQLFILTIQKSSNIESHQNLVRDSLNDFFDIRYEMEDLEKVFRAISYKKILKLPDREEAFKVIKKFICRDANKFRTIKFLRGLTQQNDKKVDLDSKRKQRFLETVKKVNIEELGSDLKSIAEAADQLIHEFTALS